MRIAFVGKGGSGKTTASSLFIRTLMEKQVPVLAMDADINQHLAEGIALSAEEVSRAPELGNTLVRLKTLLRGGNRLIPSVGAMVKTTPPGPGSHVMTLSPDDPVLSEFAVTRGGLHFLRVGGFEEEDLGARCFHAKTGAVELILNHLLDGPEDWIITDMTAGADAFASGLFTRFDLTVLVVEPTRKSLSVWQQYKQYAKEYDVEIRALGNKVQDEDDIAFLHDACGSDLIGCLSQSRWVRQTERGAAPDLDTLEPDNREVLEKLIHVASSLSRDWERYWHHAIHFHEKNAVGWANEAAGCDVTAQIDRAFLTRFARSLQGSGKDAVTGTRLRA